MQRFGGGISSVPYDPRSYRVRAGLPSAFRPPIVRARWGLFRIRSAAMFKSVAILILFFGILALIRAITLAFDE